MRPRSSVHLARLAPLLLARVSGASMEPTLREGDLILARRLWRAPRPGEVVLLAREERLILKRVAQSDSDKILVGVENPYGWVPRRAALGLVLLAWRPGRGRVPV